MNRTPLQVPAQKHLPAQRHQDQRHQDQRHQDQRHQDQRHQDQQHPVQLHPALKNQAPRDNGEGDPSTLSRKRYGKMASLFSVLWLSLSLTSTIAIAGKVQFGTDDDAEAELRRRIALKQLAQGDFQNNRKPIAAPQDVYFRTLFNTYQSCLATAQGTHEGNISDQAYCLNIIDHFILEEGENGVGRGQ